MRNDQIFPNVDFLAAVNETSSCSASCQHLVCQFPGFSHSDDKWCWGIFSYVYCHLCIFLRWLFRSFIYFLNCLLIVNCLLKLFVFLLLNFEGFKKYFRYRYFTRYMFCKYLLLLYGLSFNLLNSVFHKLLMILPFSFLSKSSFSNL